MIDGQEAPPRVPARLASPPESSVEYGELTAAFQKPTERLRVPWRPGLLQSLLPPQRCGLQPKKRTPPVAVRASSGAGGSGMCHGRISSPVMSTLPVGVHLSGELAFPWRTG